MQNTELSSISKHKDDSDSNLAKSIWVRWVCIGLAWVCLAIGTLGIIIPGLPTFDFYFLATIFAAKGSARLHRWIVQNRVIGPILQQWKEHKTLPTKAKILSLLSMSLAAGLMLWKVPHPYFVGIAIIIMIAVQIWIWWKK
ncbi:YbaN family protein [Acinetobacter sp. WCHAc060042]|uniref:YbaN family protein n=1 Tax=Acinetobacter sp. WCHAc060042 TaxID=2213016 RepID=UPI001BC8721E|nr:YbaN family protein [Acinetobacter sp. WCHAc060042]